MLFNPDVTIPKFTDCDAKVEAISIKLELGDTSHWIYLSQYKEPDICRNMILRIRIVCLMNNKEIIKY